MSWQRPIHSRYLDPLELVWLSTARRLDLTIRRDPAIFSRTDGTGMLWLGPRDDLDADDTVCQMIFHELCHWITNGVASRHVEDWGFPLSDADDPREYACLRLQAALADRHGLRGMLGPTGLYRRYFDQLPDDPFGPVADPGHRLDETRIVVLARDALARAEQPPFCPLHDALAATARLRDVVAPFLDTYATEIEDDELPSLWGR